MAWLVWTGGGYLCPTGVSRLAADATWWTLEEAKWQATLHQGSVIGYRPELDHTS